MSTGYRSIPSVEKLLSDSRVEELIDVYSRESLVYLVRRSLEQVRQEIAEGKPSPSFDEMVDSIASQAASLWRPKPIPLINATGVVLHTNLGRSPLSDEAVEAMLQAARGYTNLELDLADGARGSRQSHVESLLCQITGAEAALVVNNNASAVLLGLSAIANGKEVIVSRGEAVEIGGGFRIPDVLRQSGAALVEVGTTNRTYLADYESALTQDTAAMLKVHTSNFRVIGFTHEATVEELAALGAGRGTPVLHDQGSGCLLDTTRFGLAREPMVQDSIAAGADLVFFSGDKLLGGPQAGIVAGKRELGESLEKVPIWRMISTPVDALEKRARSWQKSVGDTAQVVQGLSAIGGGSLPGESIPTWLLSIGAQGTPEGAQGLAKRLREADTPVIARIEDDRVLLDPRTVLTTEEAALLAALKSALGA
ncbi:L-seryl-tRNA(Sec) selenium transferase [Geodia barretti]|uniref:L-seryl-tRNA(Sec) selenium transferase n=1 Tax=Geodia barretti TaxID=519541 RepID=A0AA35TP51_GEOBA|nr:L-seryl-tRNA(Sec) selenium transferase [Geodia barretti]